MIFVVLYVLISAFVFVKMLKGASKKYRQTRITNNHPELRGVRPDEPLLVIRFDERPCGDSSERPADLGFARFLADHGPYNGDSADS